MTDKTPGRRPYTPPDDRKTREWWDAHRTKLEELWASGLPTAEIGLRLGVTKNAVIGKAGRWNLPARANPSHGIKAGEPRLRNSTSGTRYKNDVPLPRPPRAVRPVMAPQPIPPAPKPPSSAAQAPATPKPIMPRRIPVQQAVPLPTVVYSRFKTCQEIIGPATGSGFEFTVPFCDAATKPGKSYCEDHYRKNFTSFRYKPRKPFIPNKYPAGALRHIVDEDAA